MAATTNRRDFVKVAVGPSISARLNSAAAFPITPPEVWTTPSSRLVLEPFNYRGVTLDGGLLRRQFDDVRDDYLRIPNDDLLKGFRKRAGRPAPGVDLGGWYSSDTFHVFGQILSGLSRMYAASGDPECREKIDALVRGWAECLSPDGFFYYSDHPNAPHYTYDKMVGGLLDAHLYGNNQDALPLLSRITDWAIKNLDREKVFSYNNMNGNTEWYTLSENLYRAYLVTGETKYGDFAAQWEYSDYWNLYAQKADIFSPFEKNPVFGNYHAYSHVNTLSGAGAAYLVTGEPQYLDTLKNAYDYLLSNQTFATGGFGPAEHLLRPGEIPPTLWRVKNHFETQCGSWAVFKLAKYLTTFTGDAKYGDWIELLVLNGIGASIPMAPDGKVFYYSEYQIHGASKRNIFLPWSCCTGTRPMAVADYHDLIYFKGPDGLHVNLFAPSTVRWNHAGTDIQVIQRTRFPEEEKTEFTLRVKLPATFGVSLRVPGWLAGLLSATVNGQPLAVRADEHHWATFQREWRDGDRLTFALPMKFWLSSFPSAGRFPAAIMRGPVTLACRSAGASPAENIDFDALDSNFIPSPGEPNTYHLKSDPAVLVRPFYAFKEGEPYFVYLHPHLDAWAKKLNCNFNGEWGSSCWYWDADKADASAEYEFEGTGIRWKGFRFEDGGQAEVTIDGQVVASVDQYGPAKHPTWPIAGPALPFEWQSPALSPGKHKIGIRVLARRNESSNGHRITVSEFEVV